MSDVKELIAPHNIKKGICFHNNVVYENAAEWTTDTCTTCTCQVRFFTANSSVKDLSCLSS